MAGTSVNTTEILAIFTVVIILALQVRKARRRGAERPRPLSSKAVVVLPPPDSLTSLGPRAHRRRSMALLR